MTDPDQGELLRAIHDAHSRDLQRYVMRLTRGDMPFAEDVVQESLLRLWPCCLTSRCARGGIRCLT